MNLLSTVPQVDLVDFLHICGDEPKRQPDKYNSTIIFSIYVEMNLAF